MRCFWTWIGCAALLLAGCGDDDGEDGNAPRITDPYCGDQVIPVMRETRLHGEFTVHDEDRDVVETVFRFSRPDGTVDHDVSSTLEGQMEQRTELLTWSLEVIGAEPGVHRLELWVRDSRGNVSNRQGCMIVAEAPP